MQGQSIDVGCGPTPGSWLVVFLLYGRRAEGALLGLFYMGMNPIHEDSSLMTNHLPRPSLLISSPWGVRFQHRYFVGTQTDGAEKLQEVM